MSPSPAAVAAVHLLRYRLIETVQTLREPRDSQNKREDTSLNLMQPNMSLK